MEGSWLTTKVADAADVTDYVANGSFASLKENVRYLDSHGFAILVRLTDHNNSWQGPFKYVDEHAYQFLRKSSLCPGDLVISNVGANAGTVFRVPDLSQSMTLGPNAILVKAQEERASRRFLYYYFSSRLGQNQIGSITGGSAQPKFNKTDFRLLTIGLPLLDEQRRIAAILGALDDKIELNRKMNETLEEMAQAIFKSWFIDFDGHTDVVDSEVGPIPRGWTVAPLSAQATLQTESVQPGRQPTTVWHHYSIPAFDDGRRATLDLGSSIKSGKYRVPSESVLVSKLNPRFPRVWLPDVTTAEASICSTEFMPFVPVRPAWRPYIYELFRSSIVQQEIKGRVTGTTGSRQRVKPTEIAGMSVLKPSEPSIDRFSELVAPLHKRQLLNLREAATLADLRDTLLPKLISGELRVPEAEDAVEAVV